MENNEIVEDVAAAVKEQRVDEARDRGPYEGMDLYNRYRKFIKTADLIEWRSNTLLGRLIRAKTKQSVNHTSGAVIYTMVGTDTIRRYIGEALPEGFVLSYLSDRLKHFKGEVYWSKLKEEYSLDVRVAIAEEALKLEGTPYGYKDLIASLFNAVGTNYKNGVICSEAWHIALVNVGLLQPFFNDSRCLVPGQFHLTGLYEESVRIY